MEQLVWYGRTSSRGGRRSNQFADVSINATKNGVNKSTGEQKMAVTITLRNDIHELLSTTGYVRAGIMGDRMYLAECSSVHGYKLSRNNSNNVSNRYITMTGDVLVAFAKKYAGDYMLKYDKDQDLYYIQCKAGGDN